MQPSELAFATEELDDDLESVESQTFFSLEDDRSSFVDDDLFRSLYEDDSAVQRARR